MLLAMNFLPIDNDFGAYMYGLVLAIEIQEFLAGLTIESLIGR